MQFLRSEKHLINMVNILKVNNKDTIEMYLGPYQTFIMDRSSPPELFLGKSAVLQLY